MVHGSASRVMRRFLAIALLAWPALAETITLDHYLSSLERIQQLLATNELDAARNEARAMSAHDDASSQGAYHADSSLLDAIANAQRADVQLRSRLAVMIDEIKEAPADNIPIDPKLLQRVAAEQDVPELVKGGEVATTPKTTPILERVVETIGSMFRWIGEKFGKLLDWLFDLLPKRMVEGPGATGGMRWIVGALVIVIVLLIILLAIEVTRRSRAKAAVVEESAPLGSKRDEDPLSRGASEWERYAAQLAAARRFREAIRAWYHAVLVTCYSAGVLHYRKSRTNWEYVSALAPSVPWRPEFITLTRRFEREWYGSDQSTPEALDDCRSHARAIIESVRGGMRGAA